MEGHAEHAATIGSLLWPVVNFSIFIYVLVRFLGGPLREFFRARAERLREELDAGDRARREAEALRAALAKDLADLPAMRARLKDDVRATAERQRDELLAQGTATADRIRADAKLVAAQELAAARRSLRDEVVTSAIGEATALVRSAMQPADQERFVKDFVTRAGAAS